MPIIGKIFAITMLPLSLIIICDALGIFSLQLPFNKVIISAILMIALQLLTVILTRIKHGKLGVMPYVTAGIFILVALLAVFSDFVSFLPSDKLQLMLGVMMFVEALYALH